MLVELRPLDEDERPEELLLDEVEREVVARPLDDAFVLLRPPGADLVDDERLLPELLPLFADVLRPVLLPLLPPEVVERLLPVPEERPDDDVDDFPPEDDLLLEADLRLLLLLLLPEDDPRPLDVLPVRPEDWLRAFFIS